MKTSSKIGIGCLIAVIFLIALGLIFGFLSYQHSQKIKSAEVKASKVLSKVEDIESAVNVSTTLPNFTKKATKAKQEVSLFSRSEEGNLLPEFTTALEAASQNYIDSARAWSDAQKKAEEKYDKAYEKWSKSPALKLPDIQDYLENEDDSEYQLLWTEASGNLDTARNALEEAR